MIKKLIVALLIFIPSLCLAGQVTTVTVYEKDGVTTTNYPLTFGIVFKDGDVPASVKCVIGGSDATTQVDVKRTWASGNVKHAVISTIIPNMPANGSVTISLETNTSTNNTGHMTQSDILNTDVESEIDLTNLSGSSNPSSASASLRTELTNAASLDYWLKGPVCTEVLEDCSLTSNDNLHARWEARFYPSTSFGIRISTIVESVNLSALGNSTYDVALKYGHASPSTVYTYTGYAQPYGARWRKTFWLGNEPPEVELHYDTDYLISTGMIPSFDTSINVTSSDISDLYSIYTTRNGEIRGGTDIDGAGNIYRAMPMVGGRDELGILPTWQMYYLMTYDNTAREMVLGNGNIAGQIATAHYREGDSSKNYYMKAAVSIDSRPMVKLYNLTSDVPEAIGDIPDNPNSWNPDRNHQLSFAYLPYLITGEHFYMEEMEFWASYNLGYSYWARNGHGDIFDFSSSFSGYNAGIIHDETRGVAWSMRNIADPVIILPNSEDTLINYFKEKLNNTFEWLEMANNATNGTGVHFIAVSRRMTLGDYPWCDAPWQHDFNVIVLNDIIRKKEAANDLDALKDLRDFVGYFTVGRFTNDPSYNKWDGAAYYEPLRKKNGDDFADGDWASFYNECKQFWLDEPSHDGGAPHETEFNPSWVADPESYVYIAKAALSGLTHLTNGEAAYNFVVANYDSSLIHEKPQWGALVPYDHESSPPVWDGMPFGGNSQFKNIGAGNSTIRFK